MLGVVTGRLTLCATPIGNLGDIPSRLGEALGRADVVFAEDTRRAATLLRTLGIKVPLRSYFVGNEARRSVELAERLAAGEAVALITDAGMPAISDPGVSAVRAALEVGAEVGVVPGPSAVTAALAVSGLPADRFAFEGFLPRKGGNRARRLDELAVEARTVVLFAAKSRLVADLADLAAALGGDRPVTVCRELTKVYEEVWRGTLAVAAAEWGTRENIRGEFTLVVGGRPTEIPDLDHVADMVEVVIESGESLTDAVRRVAADSRVSRRALYEEVLRRRS